MLQPIAEAYGEPTLALTLFRANILCTWAAEKMQWPKPGSIDLKHIEDISQALCDRLRYTRRCPEAAGWSQKELQLYLNTELVSYIAPASLPCRSTQLSFSTGCSTGAIANHHPRDRAVPGSRTGVQWCVETLSAQASPLNSCGSCCYKCGTLTLDPQILPKAGHRSEDRDPGDGQTELQAANHRQGGTSSARSLGIFSHGMRLLSARQRAIYARAGAGTSPSSTW